MSRVAELFLNLAAVPTVPFGEHRVLRVLDRVLAEIGDLEAEVDRFGNRIVRLRRGDDAPAPVVFVAHVDHPGFLFTEIPAGGSTRLEGVFEGRVRDEFFPGSPLLLFPSDESPPIRATIAEASDTREKTDNRAVTVEAERAVPLPSIGVWDVGPPRVEDGILSALACDDLAGCAAMLAALEVLAASAEPIDVTMVFTRAEEAGFCGLLALLSELEEQPLIDPQAAFLSVEISGETSDVKMGDGAIIRVGDLASTFDSAVVHRCSQAAIAHSIAARRALMDRGTCEATPMIRAGLAAGGICAPVRHYHNMDSATGKIVPEEVALADLEALVALVAAVSREREGVLRSAPGAKKLNYELFLEKARTKLTRDPFEESVAIAQFPIQRTATSKPPGHPSPHSL